MHNTLVDSRFRHLASIGEVSKYGKCVAPNLNINNRIERITIVILRDLNILYKIVSSGEQWFNILMSPEVGNCRILEIRYNLVKNKPCTQKIVLCIRWNRLGVVHQELFRWRVYPFSTFPWQNTFRYRYVKVIKFSWK